MILRTSQKCKQLSIIIKINIDKRDLQLISNSTRNCTSFLQLLENVCKFEFSELTNRLQNLKFMVLQDTRRLAFVETLYNCNLYCTQLS